MLIIIVHAAIERLRKSRTNTSTRVTVHMHKMHVRASDVYAYARDISTRMQRCPRDI
jgi:hypothetical protein